MTMGICVLFMIIGNNFWISIGNKYQSICSKRSVISLNPFVSRCPISHGKKIKPTIPISYEINLKSVFPSVVSFDCNIHERVTHLFEQFNKFLLNHYFHLEHQQDNALSNDAAHNISEYDSIIQLNEVIVQSSKNQFR